MFLGYFFFFFALAAVVDTVEIEHVQHASESLQFGDAA
jgi:hypothetical protein